MTKQDASSWQAAIQASLSGADRVVVCGIGNDLRGDDDAGLQCVRMAAASAEAGGRTVVFIEGGETPENQTGRMREFHPDLVILIDAARSGRAPGEIFIVDPEKIADDEVSTHRISLGMLVRYIRESIGAAVLFIGLEPESTEIGGAVSVAVRASIEALSEYLIRNI